MTQLAQTIHKLPIHPLRKCDVEVINGKGDTVLTGVGQWRWHRRMLASISMNTQAHEAVTIKIYNHFTTHTHVVRKHAQ